MMRELTYYVAVSLDGFIAAPDGSFDAFDASGDHMEAIVADYADTIPAHALAALGVTPSTTRFDTVLMGWNTLQPALAAGIGSPYPHLRQIVASRQERAVDPAVTLTSNPLATVHAEKARDGAGIWLCGGGLLAGSLLPEIDRLILKRYPVALSQGIPLFAGSDHGTRTFSLTGTRAFTSGVIFEQYARS